MVFLLSHLFAFLPFCAHAYDVELYGICYNIIGPRWAYVTHHGEWSTYDGQSAAMSYSGEVVVPEQIVFEGCTYDVISVGENAFAGCESLTSVHLPSSVSSLNACAFLGCTTLQQVSCFSQLCFYGMHIFTAGSPATPCRVSRFSCFLLLLVLDVADFASWHSCRLPRGS